MNRIVKVWDVVYNRKEVKELIIVHVDNLEDLNIKEHVKNLQNSPDVDPRQLDKQATCQAELPVRQTAQPGNDHSWSFAQMMMWQEMKTAGKLSRTKRTV